MPNQNGVVELLQGRSSLGLAEVLQWGGAVLDEVYGGEPNAWRAGGGAVSLRRLSQRAGVSVSTLYRYVAVAAMWRECGEPALSHLGISHLRELLPLRSSTQAQLMVRAERERWTVTEIRRVASLHQRREDAVGRGRPSKTASYRAVLGHIQGWMEGGDRLDAVELDQLAGAEVDSLLRVVQLARTELELVEARLAQRAL